MSREPSQFKCPDCSGTFPKPAKIIEKHRHASNEVIGLCCPWCARPILKPGSRLTKKEINQFNERLSVDNDTQEVRADGGVFEVDTYIDYCVVFPGGSLPCEQADILHTASAEKNDGVRLWYIRPKVTEAT